MPAWMEQRATHILAKNPSMPKSEAYALATQQMHSLGKGPKNYGTAEGRSTAKAKFNTPKDDVKAANPGGLKSTKMDKTSEAFIDELTKISKSGLPNVGHGATAGAIWGGLHGLMQGAAKESKPDSEHFSERHPAISRGLTHAAVGGAVGGLLGGATAKGGLKGVAKEVGKKVQRGSDALSLAKSDLMAKLPNKERDKAVDDVLSKYKRAEADVLFLAFEDELKNIKLQASRAAR